MADGKTVAHIGCAKCQTVLFDLAAVPASSRGVFHNDLRPRAGTPDGADTKVCATCDGPLSRVPLPPPAAA